MQPHIRFGFGHGTIPGLSGFPRGADSGGGAGKAQKCLEQQAKAGSRVPTNPAGSSHFVDRHRATSVRIILTADHFLAEIRYGFGGLVLRKWKGQHRPDVDGSSAQQNRKG